MSVAVVVQARMRSTRLPGKVLLDLAGRTVLSHVLERCHAIPGADKVVCAVPDDPADDPVAAEALRCGALVVRGPEDDVLERYRRAADQVGAEIVMRVTSDCPAIDPWLCGAVLAVVTRGEADYSSNNLPRTWPLGLDCEAFTTAWLNRAGTEAATPSHREHVTPFIRTHPDVRRVNIANPAGDQHDLRWTLDHPADLAFFRAAFAHLPEGPSGWRAEALMAIIQANPALREINAGIDHGEGMRKSQAADRAAGTV